MKDFKLVTIKLNNGTEPTINVEFHVGSVMNENQIQRLGALCKTVGLELYDILITDQQNNHEEV